MIGKCWNILAVILKSKFNINSFIDTKRSVRTIENQKSFAINLITFNLQTQTKESLMNEKCYSADEISQCHKMVVESWGTFSVVLYQIQLKRRAFVGLKKYLNSQSDF